MGNQIMTPEQVRRHLRPERTTRAKRFEGKVSKSKRARLLVDSQCMEAVRNNAYGDGWSYLPGLRLLNIANRREHWTQRKYRNSAQAMALRTVLAMRWGMRSPALPVTVTITRYGPKDMDDDGAIISAKYLRDAIATWLGVDDGERDKVRFVVKAEQGEYGVRVEFAAGRCPCCNGSGRDNVPYGEPCDTCRNVTSGRQVQP